MAWLSRGAFVLAVSSASLAVFAGFGSRAGWWHFRTGFHLLEWAAYGGLAAVVLGALGGLASFSQATRRGLWFGLIAILIGLPVVGIPWDMKRTAQRVPAIHDITTDVEDPPRFVSVLPLRRASPNSAEYGGSGIAEQQQRAYPDLRSLPLPVPAQKAFALALQAAQSLGWDLVAADEEEGRIEATDTTFWFGFKDDVVVRIRARGDHSVVDIRSLSRVGKSDVGANAKRIRDYVRTLNDVLARA
jgi:uncharacterized protein (DUF1499 family)